MILHRLDGCAPTPLANYLKALGVLRIVSEQLDPAARGWWEGEQFLLASRCDLPELENFFLAKYAPSAMVNPWGARSGFYPGSNERTSREVLQLIEKSNDSRFESFKQSIESARKVLVIVTGGSKPGDSDERGKLDVVLGMKSQLRGPASNWLQTVIAVVDGSEKHLQQPAIFGTGGSEGSGSYSAAFMKSIRECLIDRSWDHALPASLLGSPNLPDCLWGESFGQFLPAGIGTPWDLLLAFEGACLVRSSIVKRSEAVGDRWMSSPFFIPPTGAGNASSGRLDEFALNKGKELPGRGEQWFPLWTAPMTSQELSNLFKEGRALVGRRHANSAVSMGRAIAGLGVCRGVREFVRYGYLQRNNQATHFAVPLGRFAVPDHKPANVSCLDDLDNWLPTLRRQARDKHAPVRLIEAERRLTDALFAVVQHPDNGLRWQAVLLRMADIEALQIRGSGTKAGPIPRLRPEWVEAADDGSPEIRLALALALQSGPRSAGKLATGVRRHWLTLEKGRFKGTSSDRVMQARNGIDDAIALVSRRLIEAAQNGMRQLPLLPGFGCAASRHDLARLVAGDVDLDRCLALARALMALDLRACQSRPPRLLAPAPSDWPDDAWNAIRLALLPWPLPDGRHAGCDPAIVRRLESGDLAAALTIAIRRLRAAGIPCTVRAGTAPPETARRYAAALAFPIARDTAAQLAQRLSPTPEENAA